MGLGLNANLVGTKQASELTSGVKNLQNIYNKSVDEQKDAISNLFTQKYYNSSTEKANIDAQIQLLETQLEESKKKIEEIEEKIADKQADLKKYTDELSARILEITIKTEDYEDSCKEAVDNAIKNAYASFNSDSHSKFNGGEKSLSDYLVVEMGQANSYINGGTKTAINNLINALADPQSKISGLTKDTEGLLGDINTLNSQYATQKSTHALLTRTRDNMVDAQKSYQTSDTDPSVPIFTPEKEALADGWLAQYNSRLANRESEPQKATTNSNKAIVDKYKANVAQKTGSDPYNATNAQLKSFDEAVKGGLVQEMQAAGLTPKEMLDTIKEIYPSIGVYHADNGQAVVPYGHGGEGKTIYDNFVKQFQGVGGKITRSDKQLEEMGKALKNDNIIGEMKNNNFSWKEAAYTITKLWPQSGVEYNLGEKAITIPNGSGKDTETYNKLAADIKKNYPDVEITRGTAEERAKIEETKRTDPVGFADGNNTYEFVIDRNQDGKFNNFSEMLGANGTDGITELLSFDKNGDNKLTGDELNNLTLLKTSHGETNDADKTNDMTNYEFISAKQLGIEEINLQNVKDVKQSRPDGSTEDFVGINNSLVTNNFDIKVNGQTKQGYQKFVTEDYMNAVYSPMFNQNINFQLDDNTVNGIIDKNFNEAAGELANLNEYANSLNDAKQYDNIQGALRSKLNAAVNEANAYKSSESAKVFGESLYSNRNKEEVEMSEAEADAIIERNLTEEDLRKLRERQKDGQ